MKNKERGGEITMVDVNKHYRMAIFLIVYGPYQDVHDIFLSQFRKNWPDCPYPLVIGNQYYELNDENILTLKFEDGVGGSDRLNKILDTIEADYYLGFEADRVIMDRVETSEVEKILDFIEANNIQYFRCHASRNKKKKADIYEGYLHFFHIRANEPYGVPGSSAIWSKELRSYLRANKINGYQWEALQNERAATTHDRWIDGYATDDRNVFHILHCVEKKKWIRSAKRNLLKDGIDIMESTRDTQTLLETVMAHTKELFMRIPGKTRFRIKKLLKIIGFKFSTDY